MNQLRRLGPSKGPATASGEDPLHPSGSLVKKAHLSPLGESRVMPLNPGNDPALRLILETQKRSLEKPLVPSPPREERPQSMEDFNFS